MCSIGVDELIRSLWGIRWRKLEGVEKVFKEIVLDYFLELKDLSL